jgi:hypothetical protein
MGVSFNLAQRVFFLGAFGRVRSTRRASGSMVAASAR